MTGLVKSKKYFDKISYKLPFIISETLFVLALASICAVITLAPSWYLLGAQPLQLDQIIFFISVLSANIIAFRFPVWFPSRSRFVEVTCEIIQFSLSEMSVFVPTSLHLFWNHNYLKKYEFRTETNTIGDTNTLDISIMSLSCYVVLFPLTNTMIHSAYIQQLMRKPKYTLSAYSAAVQAGYGVIGVGLLYGSLLGAFDLSELNIYALLILILQGATILMVVMHLHTYNTIVKRMKDEQSTYTLSYLIVIFIALMPMLISIVVVLKKYGAASLVNEIRLVAGNFEHLKNHQESAEFTELSIVWSFSSSVLMSFGGSLLRDIYLMEKIESE